MLCPCGHHFPSALANRNSRAGLLGHVSPFSHVPALGPLFAHIFFKFHVVCTNLTHEGKYSYLVFKLATWALTVTSTMSPYYRMFYMRKVEYLVFRVLSSDLVLSQTLRVGCFCTDSNSLVMLLVALTRPCICFLNKIVLS